MLKKVEFRILKFEARRIALIGLGAGLSQLAQVLMSITDAIMMGWLGKEYLAAGVLVSSLHTLGLLFCMGVLMAIPPLLGIAIGEGDNWKATSIMRCGNILAIVLSTFQVGYLLIIPYVLRLVMGDSSIVDYSTRYTYWLIPGVIPWILFILQRLALTTYENVTVTSFGQNRYRGGKTI